MRLFHVLALLCVSVGANMSAEDELVLKVQEDEIAAMKKVTAAGVAGWGCRLGRSYHATVCQPGWPAVASGIPSDSAHGVADRAIKSWPRTSRT